MREIKFRGQTINGEWAYGLLCHKDDKWYVSNSAGIPTAYEVRPETIGQFTGLVDKNGKEIYEGDVVKWEGYIDIISWHQNANNYLAPGWYKGHDSDDLGAFHFKKHSHKIEEEVIGNIYESPELLK